MTSLTAFGRLTRDPEMRYTSKGTAIATFSLACGSAMGKEIQTAFVDFKAWGGQATAISKLRKGDPLLCWAVPATESWDDKQTGAKRSKLVFTVTGIAGTEAQDDSGEQRPASRGSAAPPVTQSVPPSQPIDPSDDVPFRNPPQNTYRLNL